MKLFEDIGKAFKKMEERKGEKAFKELLGATDKIEEDITHAIRIERGKTDKESLDEYYKTLAIKRTTDQKIIRSAYVSLIKKYHPDINKGEKSEDMAKKLNEAYHTLSEKGIETTFEDIFSTGRMNPSIKIEATNSLLAAYTKKKKEDYELLQGKIKAVTDINALTAVVEEFTDWKRRVEKVKKERFGSLYKIGAQLKRLKKRNNAFYKVESDAAKKALLEQNAAKLESLSRTYGKLIDDIDFITASVVRESIEPEERRLTKEMDDWMAYIRGL